MTKTQEAALQELGLDEKQLAEKTARAEALARGETHQPIMTMAEIMESEIRADMKPPRKKRSDAGKPKPKAPAVAQKPTATLATQVSRLKDLYETKMSRIAELETINDEIEDLGARRAEVLGSLDGLAEQIEAAWAEILNGAK